MRTITLEEHFMTEAFLKGPGQGLRERERNTPRLAGMVDRLLDLGEKRIAEMDAAGIGVQVLSLTAPGVQLLGPDAAIVMARDANERLAAAVSKLPERLAGFAALPTAAPEAAAAELERCVREYGFKGALIHGHTSGRYLDDKFFWTILERAEALEVPIYLHPAKPPQPVVDASYGGFSPILTEMLTGAGWGWHIETAVHVIRMILGGVFDRFPKLQIVIGHMGEALPFMLPRLDIMGTAVTKLERPMSAYLRENVQYTFAGFNFLPNFLDLLLEVGVARILFSADYPYASMAEARAFLDRLPVSGADREQIAHGNAERLLRM